MNERMRRWGIVAALCAVSVLAPACSSRLRVAAQESTPVPGAQTWQVLVNNVSPAGQNWSFNTFYPDKIQVHAGDSIEFTLAPNQQAFHTVHLLALGMNPMEFYQGFSGGFVQPDPIDQDAWQRTFFGYQAAPPCGRAGQDSCVLIDITDDISFGLASPVLVNPPAEGGDGNTSFTVTIDAAARPGPYYITSDVDGPSMVGRIDVLPPDQPVQTAEDLALAAQRQYEADFSWFTGYDRIDFPAQASNPDGTKTWQVAAGNNAQNRPWLSINEFAPSDMVIIAGDTVTWTNDGPAAAAHTVSGFSDTRGALPQDLDPYQPACITASGEYQLPPEGSLPTDIWNTCPGQEAINLTAASLPSAPSGDPYVDGDRTSGILLDQQYLDSAIGQGLPFTSTYSVRFDEAGTYTYQCAIHSGMTGTIVVLPKPQPR